MKTLLVFAVATLFAYPIMIVTWSFFVPKVQIENLRYPLGGGGHLFSRLKEAKDHPQVDIVFLGSSHTYRSFDTRIWAAQGYSSFNLGSSAQSPVQTELIVNEYLTQLKPKIIVYEVYGLLAKFDGVESALDLIANRPMDKATLTMALRINNIKVLNSLVYAAFRKWSGHDRGFVESYNDGKDRYVNGGFVERLDTSQVVENQSSSKYVEPLLFQFEAFQRTLATLRTSGYKVILVSSPSTKDHYERSRIRSPEYYERLNDQPDFLNLNGVEKLTDPALYYDQHHPKQRGVELINDILIDSLYARGYLPLGDSLHAH